MRSRWDQPRLVSEDEGYSNFFRIAFDSGEVVLDFGHFFSDTEHNAMHTSIVTTPRYARELAIVLRRALDAYESHYGPIEDLAQPLLRSETES